MFGQLKLLNQKLLIGESTTGLIDTLKAFTTEPKTSAWRLDNRLN
jgi:hypothetical protein